MKRPWLFLTLTLTSLIAVGLAYRYQAQNKPASLFPQGLPDTALKNFELYDTESHSHELYRYADRRAIVFISQGLDCPGVQKSAATIAELAKTFAPRGVALFGLNPNLHDSKEDIAQEARQFSMTWPILRDPSQLVARALGFTSTAEAVVIDTHSWQVVYRGPIDDRLEFGTLKGASKNNYLADALEAVLAGNAVKNSGLRARGCVITYRKDDVAPTYSGEIGKILKTKCVSCHSESGAMKPYFTGYESVRGWSAMIRQTVMTGQMPLWGIDSKPDEFTIDRSLTPEEKRLLITWIDNNMPRGTTADPISEFVPTKNREPDPGAAFIAEMKEEVVVPPSGLMDYGYFEIGRVPRDMWVSSVEGFTSNPGAMHHATLNVTPSSLSAYKELARQLEESKESGSFPGEGVWLSRAMRFEEGVLRKKNVPPPPGSPYRNHELIRFSVYSMYGRNNKRTFPKNTARFLPKGYYLILETHHHETGKQEREKSTVYFYEAKKSAAQKTMRSFDQVGASVVVPPYERNFRYDLPPFEVSQNSTLLGCSAHLHARGKEFHAWAELPDKSVKRVIAISSFLFSWHTAAPVFFTEPLRLPAGTRIHSYAILDNSATNPYNPDPSAEIQFGQTLNNHEMPKFQCAYYFDKE